MFCVFIINFDMILNIKEGPNHDRASSVFHLRNRNKLCFCDRQLVTTSLKNTLLIGSLLSCLLCIENI